MGNEELSALTKAVMELNVQIKHIDTKQDEMLSDVKSIKEAIYNPENGLYARVKALETKIEHLEKDKASILVKTDIEKLTEWKNGLSKFMWSIGIAIAGLILNALADKII